MSDDAGFCHSQDENHDDFDCERVLSPLPATVMGEIYGLPFDKDSSCLRNSSLDAETGVAAPGNSAGCSLLTPLPTREVVHEFEDQNLLSSATDLHVQPDCIAASGMQDDPTGSYLFVPDDGLDFRENPSFRGRRAAAMRVARMSELCCKERRAASIARWLAKRRKRKAGALRLSSRKRIARSRPRVNGKFVKTSRTITADAVKKDKSLVKTSCRIAGADPVACSTAQSAVLPHAA